jgi:histidine triad (HIT) family protein
MSECVFCKIVNKEIYADIILDNEDVLAFADVNPVSPIHYLIIPKQHCSSLMDMPDNLMLSVHHSIKEVAKQLGVDDSGFRVVNNCGEDGGQVVDHVHFHFLAKRHHGWPPG